MTHDNSPKWRTQFTPWKSAGNRTETGGTADEVVRQTGWVFNNETGYVSKSMYIVPSGVGANAIIIMRFGRAGGIQAGT